MQVVASTSCRVTLSASKFGKICVGCRARIRVVMATWVGLKVGVEHHQDRKVVGIHGGLSRSSSNGERSRAVWDVFVFQWRWSEDAQKGMLRCLWQERCNFVDPWLECEVSVIEEDVCLLYAVLKMFVLVSHVVTCYSKGHVRRGCHLVIEFGHLCRGAVDREVYFWMIHVSS